MERPFDMETINDAIDPELNAAHHALLSIYNRETIAVKKNPTSVVSINATHFLAGQVTIFADAALILMLDGRQPLNAPVALLRTCLEAQARANHIIAAAGQVRESRAAEFEELMQLGHKSYEASVIKLYQDFSHDESKFQPRDRPYLPALKSAFGKVDTSKAKASEKRYRELSRNWTYGKVVERDKFGDSRASTRSEAQPLQPGLNLMYIQCCAFVHSDPASIAHVQLLSKIDVTFTLVLTELISVMCLFTPLGKEKDQDLLNIKRTIMAYDINERILPKASLPSA
jgi:hypothetical protein